MKGELKIEAVALRRKGFSYKEILKDIPVAKSTLSLWLRSVNLSKRQQQRLSWKKLNSAKQGGFIKKNKRLDLEKTIQTAAIAEVKNISKRELWFMGTMLYWAEGAKAKDYNPSQGLIFSNSDPFMINVFIKWLKDIIKVTEEDIKFDVYIHETYKDNLYSVKEYWASMTGFSMAKFDRIYFKKHTLSSRKNTGDNYHGILRVKVSKSTNLNRKIKGWIEGIYQQCRVV